MTLHTLLILSLYFTDLMPNEEIQTNVGYFWILVFMLYCAVMCFFLFKDLIKRFKQWVVTTRAKLKGKSFKKIMKFKLMDNDEPVVGK